MELSFELEFPGGVVRPVTVLGAERPTVAQIERRLAKVLQGEGITCDADAVRLRSARLQRELLGPRTLVREGIEDGERLVLHSRATTERPAPSAVTSPGRPGGLPMPALLGAVAVGAVIACAAFGFAALLHDDDAGAGQTTASVVASDATDYGIEPAYEDAPAEPVEESSGVTDDTTAVEDVAGEEIAPPEPEPLEPAFEGGDWVQLASFRSSDSAWSEAERLGAAGIDATVLDSSDAEELFPGFHVVAAGPLTDAADRRRVLRGARAAGIGDARARTLTPATSALEIATLSGLYTGEIELIDPAHPSRNQTWAARLYVDEDGMAQLGYDDLDCDATLEQGSLDGAVGTWEQTAANGGCIRRGEWTLKLVGDEVLMSWRRDGTERWMAARMGREAE